MQDLLWFILTVLVNLALLLLALKGLFDLLYIRRPNKRKRTTNQVPITRQAHTREEELWRPFDVSQVVPGHPDYVLRGDYRPRPPRAKVQPKRAPNLPVDPVQAFTDFDPWNQWQDQPAVYGRSSDREPEMEPLET